VESEYTSEKPVLSAIFDNPSKFGKVLTKDKFAQFFETRCIWRVYRNSPTFVSDGTIPDLLQSYCPLPLDWIGGSQPHPKLQSKIVGKRVHIEE